MLLTNSNCWRLLRLIVLLICWLTSPALSQAQFYQGKTLTILQSSDPGDTSDTMVRATIPVLRKHIPGEPTIAYQYMPGGGGTKAANHIFHNTKPDGLTIGRIGGGLVANAALKEAGVLYDLDKLIYLGSPTAPTTGFLSPGAMPALAAWKHCAKRPEYASAPRRSAIPIISSAACLLG